MIFLASAQCPTPSEFKDPANPLWSEWWGPEEKPEDLFAQRKDLIGVWEETWCEVTLTLKTTTISRWSINQKISRSLQIPLFPVAQHILRHWFSSSPLEIPDESFPFSFPNLLVTGSPTAPLAPRRVEYTQTPPFLSPSLSISCPWVEFSTDLVNRVVSMVRGSSNPLALKFLYEAHVILSASSEQAEIWRRCAQGRIRV